MEWNDVDIDFNYPTPQFEAVLKRVDHFVVRCLILCAALMVFPSLAGSEQILPQLIAQVASFDRDHGVALRAGPDRIDLIFTHGPISEPQMDEGQFVQMSPSEPTHVVPIVTGTTLLRQGTSLGMGGDRQGTANFCAVVAWDWTAFVPKVRLAYSRPPPAKPPVSLFHRSSLLQI